jgi:plastocyanin
MANVGRLRGILVSSLLVAAVAVGVFVFQTQRAGRTPARLQTVDLSMRDYTFNGTNPTFRFRVGDRVRFVVRNEEQTPIRHNFAIPTLGIPCATELGPGEIRHVLLTLKKPGTYEYLCCTHRGMGGALIVTR